MGAFYLCCCIIFALCYAMLEVTENSLPVQTDNEENSVPLRRLIREIREGLVKDGLTDLPTGMIKISSIFVIFSFFFSFQK